MSSENGMASRDTPERWLLRRLMAATCHDARQSTSVADSARAALGGPTRCLKGLPRMSPVQLASCLRVWMRCSLPHVRFVEAYLDAGDDRERAPGDAVP